MSSPAEVHDVVVGIVARVLGVTSDVARGARRGDNEDWDSLKHIEIIFQVEEEFALLLGEEDLATLCDVDSIVAAVERTRGR